VPGAPPGTLVPREDAQRSIVAVWAWNAGTCREQPLGTIEDLERYRETGMSVWLDITGIPATGLIREIGQAFNLHPLSLEDVFGSGQRPKVEHYDSYDFVVLKALAISGDVSESVLSIFLGERFVITFQEHELDLLEPVRARLRNGRGRIRERGPDYLAYAVIDSAIDHYFPVVEELDDRIELAEARVLEPGSREVIGLSGDIRRDLRTIRHAVWPLRDVLASMLHDGGAFLTDDTRLYLRDSYDHVVQLQEMVDFSREVAASLLEAYISTVSLETNQVMRVLTLIATVFIPLTFITGVYGMNFDPIASPFNMPELRWYWGYPFSLGLMLGTAGLFLLFFRRMGWIGGGRKRKA
jgi:magnesium transporter